MEGISLGSAFLRLYGDRSALDRELETLKRYTDQLEKQGIKVKFDADTGQASREVDQLKNKLNGLNDILRSVGQGLQGDSGAWAGLQQALGGVTGGAGGAGGAMGKFGGALGGAMGVASKALPVLGQLGLAAQGLQAIFFGVSAAVNSVLGPLQQLSQQSGRFNQQVAEAGIFTSQSFGILGPDGKAIEGTANQMRAVRGVITKEYKEIQKEVAKISGATASEIYEGFNLILQNSSALGKEGEDLGKIRKLSTRLAAGMNVLGVPGQQLRSEVSSLLTGDIQMYDQLPKKLGYDRATVEKLKSEGRFYEDLMQKLEKLYQGQEVLSASLSNVQSNFEDVFQTISTEGGQALERGLAGGLKSVLDSLDTLQGSFAGALRAFSEGLEPILRILGEVGGWLVSLGSMVASLVQIVGDFNGVLLNLIGLGVLPALKAVGGVLQVIAKVFELVAAAASTALRPISVFFRVLTGQTTDSIDSFFDGILKFFDDLIDKAEGAAATVARPFVEMAKGVAWLQGKLRGMTAEEIAQRQAVIESEFATSLGGGDEPELRSLNLSDSTKKLLDERAARLGSGNTRKLNEAKELSQLVQDRVKNEIQGLEQSLKLMAAQKSVQEAMNGLAESRRGLESGRANFAIQLAASPEARLAAEERRNDLAAQQEQQRINERRALLGTEREMLQTQLQIQLKQQRLQQEQLRIQRLEIQIQRDKAQTDLADIRNRMSVLRLNTPEWNDKVRQSTEARSELNYRNQQLQIIERTIELGGEMTGILQRTNALEGERLDIQGQQLGVQNQIVGLNRQQQAQLEQLERQEQGINAERDRNVQTLQEFIALRDADIRKLQEEEKTRERLQKLDESRLELQKAQAAATVQSAEAELKVAQAQQNANDNPTSVQAVIGAQIEALAAGTQGLVSEADATRRVFDAKQRQLALEQQQAREQQRIQQERERSELAIYQLNLKRLVLEQMVQQERLQAEVTLGRLREQRDAMSASVMQGGGGGVPSAPVLPAPAGGSAIPGGARTNRTRDPDAEATGWDIVMPGGRGAPVRAPVSLKITGTGFQGRGAGASGRGYGNWISGEFQLGGKTYELLLGHFDRVDVAQGMQVPAGGQLGTQGITGRTFGTHVTSHVNPKGGASVGDAWNALDVVTRVWERGAAGAPVQQAPGAAGGIALASAAGAAAPSLQNSIDQATSSIEKSKEIQQELTAQLGESNAVTMPSLLEQQGSARQGLAATQQMQQDALRLERTRAQLTAEVLNTGRGRLAGQLTEATAGTLGNSLRGVMAQMFGGEGFDLAGLSESISRSMAERFTGALIDAALAPIEQSLTQNLFRMFSGVDVEEQARKLADEQAASSLTTAGTTLQQAGTALGQAAASLAGGGATAGGPVPLEVVPFQEAGAVLAPSANGLAQSMDAAGQTIDVVATTASRTAGSFEGLMQNLGRVGAVLGGIAMGVGGAQQMGKGGTYNTLMGLAGIFGSIGSITGLFGGGGAAKGGGGGAAKGASSAMVGFTSGLDLGVQTGYFGGMSGFRALGGPVASNQAYLVGERGPELMIPTAPGTIIPNDKTQALLQARGALGGSSSSDGGSPAAAFQASREAVAAVSTMARQQQTAQALSVAMAAPARPLDVRFESRVINGVEYVTAEQFQQGMRDAAERGRAMTLKDMRNSVRTRKQLGMG